MTREQRKAKNDAKKTNDCLCGCGAKIKGYFAQGHDQRMRGYLVRAEQAAESEATLTPELKAEAKAIERAYEAGVLLKHGVTKPNAYLLRQRVAEAEAA